MASTRASSALIGTLMLCSGCNEICGGLLNEGYADLTQDTAASFDGLDCDLFMDITLNGREHAVSFDDTPVALVATIYASGDSTQRFAIVDRCPNGAVVWDGLGEGFDYDGTCVAGDCSTYGESIEYTLIPGDTLTVETSIFPGGSECTSPLAPGVYTISGHLPLVEDQETSVCSNSVQLSIQE